MELMDGLISAFPIVMITGENTDQDYQFKYFRNKKDGEFYWELRSSNHEILAMNTTGPGSKRGF